MTEKGKSLISMRFGKQRNTLPIKSSPITVKEAPVSRKRSLPSTPSNEINQPSSRRKPNEYLLLFYIPTNSRIERYDVERFATDCKGRFLTLPKTNKEEAFQDYRITGHVGNILREPYYIYEATVIKYNNTYTGLGFTLFIKNIISTTKMGLTMETLHYISMHEFKILPLHERVEITNFINNNQNYDQAGVCQGFEERFKSRLSFSRYWQANVEDFYARAIESPSSVSGLNLNQRQEIYKIMTQDPFIYAFKMIPYRSIKVPANVTILYDMLDKVGLEVREDELASYKLYKWLERLTNNHGHTCFYESEIRDDNKVHLENLIKIGAVIKEVISETNVYSLYPDYLMREELVKMITEFIDKNIDIPMLELKGIQPSIPSSSVILNEKQMLFINSVVENPITIVTGGPGTGKTEVLRRIYESLPDGECVISSIAASFVQSLILRGMSHAETTKYFIYHILGIVSDDYVQNEEPTPLDPMSVDNPPIDGSNTQDTSADIQLLSKNVRLLILDEFGTIPYHILIRVFKCFPKKTRIVLAVDPYQLPPIGKGVPSDDLLHALPPHCVVKLEQNHRLTRIESPKMLLSIKHILKNQYHIGRREMAAIKFIRTNKIAEGNMGMYNVTSDDMDMVELLRVIKSIDVNIKGINNFQILTFKRDTSLHYNTKIDNHMRLENLQIDKFYVTQRIIINQINQRYENALKLSTAKGTSIPRKPNQKYINMFSSLVNGEVFTINGFKYYDPKMDQIVTINGNGHYDSNYSKWSEYPIFISTLEGRHILIKDNKQIFDPFTPIPYENIISAWAMTVNVSQGKEFPGWVILVMPREEEMNGLNGFYNNNRIVVGMSRSMYSTVVWGSREVFERIGRTIGPPVYSRVKYMLLEIINQIYIKHGRYYENPHSK